MALQCNLMHVHCNIHYEYIYSALIRGQLLFPQTHDPCGVYARAATIRSTAYIQGNT